MNIFKIALPGFSYRDAKPNEEAVDSLYSSPKVNTLAQPSHVGILSINWQTSGIVMPFSTNRIIYSFPHGYSYIPVAFAVCQFDNGSVRVNGTLPFGIGALGEVIIDTDATNVNFRYLSSDLSNATPIPPFLLRARFYVFAERGHA